MWPMYTIKMKSLEGYEEGGIREFSVKVTAFSGAKGTVNKLHGIKIDEKYKEIVNSEFEIDCDLDLFAMGLLHPEHETMLQNLGVGLDERGNVKIDENYKTSVDGIYYAGDMRTGQSSVAYAISEGRK